MEVSKIRFNPAEAAILHMRAMTELIGQGISQEESKQLIAEMTPQNLLRLALGFDRRKRGRVVGFRQSKN